ncbi:MAG: hypothetical protein ACK514_12835 [Bacteroidota bacterium]|jgi:hypothetical protein|nr:hypothetical protein [Cytophagales bacterium]MCE2958100.1 hypothetical protein [Flammeovirgaceae bacterium]MCZ8071635.1 hypothetical protein [Cytophagales bacterium]
MKAFNSTATRISLSVLALIFIGFFSSCGSGSDAPTISKQDQVKAILTASPWKVNTVSVDGVDKTITYKDLGLTFTNTGFTSVSGGAIWPASGTWSFTSADATAIKRDDGLEVSIQEATATSLKLGLTWTKTTIGQGRTNSVSGAHVFSFRK